MIGASLPVASLSLDLDDAWTYLKTRGEPHWAEARSYLPIVVPRFLTMLDELGVKITVFVVGRDAALPQHAALLRSIVETGHDIGNHSYHHDPWLHRYDDVSIEREITRAEEAIGAVTGQRLRGFRGPGYRLSKRILDVLVERGYRYDASTLPTFFGPPEQRVKREAVYDSLRDGLRPLRPYRWEARTGNVLEIPVTTMPLLRTPIDFSHAISLWTLSPAFGRSYFTSALDACRVSGIEPSLILRPLDFLGPDEAPELALSAGMRLPTATKLGVLRTLLQTLLERFRIVTLTQYASSLARSDTPLHCA